MRSLDVRVGPPDPAPPHLPSRAAAMFFLLLIAWGRHDPAVARHLPEQFADVLEGWGMTRPARSSPSM